MKSIADIAMEEEEEESLNDGGWMTDRLYVCYYESFFL
jgi:hypothetical protein